MQAALAQPAWSSALGQRLLAFNLLPSRCLHPTHWAWDEWTQGLDRSALDPAGLRRLHRQVSAALLRSREFGTVSALDDPMLPVFMLDTEVFHRLGRYCGLLVLGPAIRRVILRDEVRALQAELDSAEVDFARKVAPRLWACRPSSGTEASLAFGALDGQVQAMGAGLLFLAAQSATPPVAQRALLRLPRSAQDDVLGLPVSIGDRLVAAQLVLSVLDHLDPVWLSEFPRRH